MNSSKKALMISFHLSFYSLLFSFLTFEISFSMPSSSLIISNINKQALLKCFAIKNDTTLEKKLYFYSNNFTKKYCLQLAIYLGYKEDIYYPKYLHRCFPLCNSCSSYSKKISEMYCISCMKGFKLENGNCIINRKYKENKRKNDLSIVLNTLNLNQKINSNFYSKKYFNGIAYYFKEKENSLIGIKRRKLYKIDDYDDYSNNIINRESQSSLSNDKSKSEYNFHIELSPYYLIAQRCISKGNFFIENDRCVSKCTPQLETYFNYPVVEIKTGPEDKVTVCDCKFRCCTKRLNNLSKSLDRGYIDGSYKYFRRQIDGACLVYTEGSYYDRGRTDTYLLAQDFVPCFFPIYNDNDEIEFYFSGYEKTIIGNNCKTRCPTDNPDQYYYYNPENSGCYKCPENCTECNGIPTNENGYCIKCKEGYNSIYKGFCNELCPLYYGEKNGFCIECTSDEVVIEGKCIKKTEINSYGDSTNPIFQDENDPKIYHKCIEYIGNNAYSISKGKNDKCSNVECPNDCYDKLDGYCYKCPDGCLTCNYEGGKLTCNECDDGYSKESVICEKNKCNFFTMSSNGGIECYKDECPKDFFYLDKDDGAENFECIPICHTKENNYFNTITSRCKVRCIGDDSTVIDAESLCLEKCDKNYPENIDGVCVNCALNSQFNNNGTCVIKDENFDEIYFILSGEENEKYGRVGSCYIIDERGDYHPEHIKSREYDPNLCPDDCPSTFEKKHDENGEIVCIKCYKTCETCDHTGVAGIHRCTKCKEGYQFSKRFYGVCDEICSDEQLFYYDNNNREKKCVDSCPEEIPFIAESNDENENNLECLGNCTDNNQYLINNTFTCVKECPEEYNIYEKICTLICPQDFGTFKNSRDCINCTQNNLYYYNGVCYNPEEEIPKETHIKDENDDGKIHDCFENVNGNIKTGYYSRINNCTRICPEEYHIIDRESKICEPCEPGCMFCDQEEGCKDECPENYYISLDEDFNSKCVSNCPSDTPYISADNICGAEECNFNEIKMLVSGDEDTGNANYKCIEDKCKDIGLYYYPLTKTCYPMDKIPKNTYFNPDNQNTDDENILISCFTEISDKEYLTGFFYTISNCDMKCPKYFYYAENNICKKCHSNCEECFGEGTDEENKCVSCIDTENKILNPYLFNCENKCIGSFHYSDDDRKIVCEEECPENGFIDINTGECITHCDKLIDDKNCVNECPTGKIESNGYCIIPQITTDAKTSQTETPQSTIPSPISTIITPTIPSNNLKEISEVIDIIEKKNISKYIEIIDENEIIKTKNGNISLCRLYINDNKMKCGDSDEEISFNGCDQKLKENYPSDNLFYIIKVDINEKNSNSDEIKSFSSQTKYKVYLSNGDEIDINNICKNEEIKIEKDIILKKNIENNKELMYKLTEEGINVYDIKDPFFNDRCYSYKDENNNDVPLKNRIEDYYQNTVICIEGCEYLGINYNTSKIICKCNANSLFIKKNEEDKSILSYLNHNSNEYDSYSSYSTIDSVKCYKETFNSDNIKKNIGFWLFLGFLLLLLFLLSGLLCCGFDYLDDYLLGFADSDGNENKMENEEEESYEEEEIVTKRVMVSSNNENVSSNENINSNERYNSNENTSNPPKKKSNDDDSFYEEKTKERSHKRVIFDRNRSNDYPHLSISNFGKGYKLSNKFEIESIKDDLENYETPKKNRVRYKENKEIDISNGSNEAYISKFNYNGQSSPSSANSINISKNEIENNVIRKGHLGSQVELEPDGALLAANNFFDTCRIVKLPEDVYEEKIHERKIYEQRNNELNNSLNKKNMRRYSCSNSYSNGNSLNKSSFFKNNKKVVNLPGFPEPQISYSEEEDNNYRKRSKKKKLKMNNNYLEDSIDFEPYRQNPLNRCSLNHRKKLEDIDEKYDDSSYIDSEFNDKNYRRKRNLKNYNHNHNDIRKKILKKEENYDNESILDDKEDIENYYKYNKNSRYNRSSLPKNNTSLISYNKSTESGSVAKQPITINKYYITNCDSNLQDGYNQRRKSCEFRYFPTINSDEKNFKEEKNEKKNNELQSKYNKNKKNSNSNKEEKITVKRRKISKNKKIEKREYKNFELNSANFEEVMLYEHRSFCGIYGSFISNYHLLFSICFSDNIYVPRTMRVIILVFTLELFFTFTALFMRLSQFEKRYKTQKDIDISYLIKNEFDNIIYTILVTKVMNFISNCLFFHFSITNVITEYKYKGEIYIRELKHALYCLKCRYYIFIVIFIILTCLQGYYISCFCQVYIGSIKEWIYCSVIAFIFELILSFFILLIAALFRNISICCQSWLFFILSNLLIFLS